MQVSILKFQIVLSKKCYYNFSFLHVVVVFLSSCNGVYKQIKEIYLVTVNSMEQMLT